MRKNKLFLAISISTAIFLPFSLMAQEQYQYNYTQSSTHIQSDFEILEQSKNQEEAYSPHKFEHTIEDDIKAREDLIEKQNKDGSGSIERIITTTHITHSRHDTANQEEKNIGWMALAQYQANEYNDEWVYERVENTLQNLDKKIIQARSEGKPYLVWVNIPSATLRLIDTNTQETLLISRVIVGAPHTQTPIFSTNIVNLKFNPDWTPPPSLAKKGSKYTPPGKNNPLGQVRFSADNNKNIYLHDTNHPELYDKKQRALSAGCIRVEKWHDMSQILSGFDTNKIDELTQDNKIKYVDVPDSLVWVSYERMDLDEDGTLVLFPDIYGKQPAPNHLQVR